MNSKKVTLLFRKFNQFNLRIKQLLIIITCLFSALSGNSALAQLTPDQTLGTENSTIRENLQVKGALADVIEGGAIRNSNLFHSFSEFNINELQRVYFANPTEINNIFTRVTGENPSNIFGTLGVNGSANLYLLNPHGFVFGENAQLDITGSFTATTADSVIFNNFNYSAINPEAPPLLNISVPLGLQYGNAQNAGIINTGNLKVGTGSILSLFAGTVINTGQLLAPEGQVIIATFPNLNNNNNSLSELINYGNNNNNLGLTINSNGEVILDDSIVENGDILIKGETRKSSIETGNLTLLSANNITLLETELLTSGDLNLLAFDTVKIRDSVTNPINIQAGGNLSIQGNQGIDILALNHPHTPFQSGGNLSLISDGIISGDAHFASRGNFSILNLSGEAGNFVSLYDPIISSEKDVIIGNYVGNSLKIESMGSIATGNIIISGADTTLTPNNDPDIDILRSSPSLILRAGVEQLQNPPTIVNPPSPIPVPIITSFTPIYYNNFEGTVGSEWSSILTDKTPIGDRQFLGQYGGNSLVNFNLDNLPQHQLATVAFDLFILKTWDGNDYKGADIWGLTVDGGFPLLVSTFSNHDSSFDSITQGNPSVRVQSYPNSYNPFSLSNANNPARTGAIENNTLGYTFPYNTGNQPMDSVYRFTLTFPHSENALGLNFLSILGGSTGIADESWGLDNVGVVLHNATTSSGATFPTIIPPPPTFTTSGQRSAGTITTGNILTLGGPVILSSTSDITFNSSVTTLGGDILVNSGGKIIANTGEINSRLDNDGGTISLQADGDILGRLNIRGGEVKLDSGGTIDLRLGTIHTQSSNNDAPITLIADGNILTNQLRSRGGDITLNSGGTINTTASEINSKLNEISGGGAITLIATGDIFTGNIKSQGGDITLNSGGEINTIAGEIRSFSEENGGNINFQANGDITAGQITSSGDEGGGNITFNTNSNFYLDGLFVVRSDGFKDGEGGDINLRANSVLLKGGSRFLTGSEQAEDGGDITVNANYVELSGSGTYPNGLRIPTVMSAATFSSGNAGNITVNAQRLLIHEGAGGLGTLTGNGGDGGDVILDVSESIELIGIEGDDVTPIGILSDTANANNRFGNQAFDGKAGDIFIKTKRLIVRDGAIISSSTLNGGLGGNLNIDASEFIQLSGTSNGFASGIYSQAFGAGNAGKLSVTTPNLIISDQATITTRTATVTEVNYPINSSFQRELGLSYSDVATGNAGDIFVKTDNLTILTSGEISASTLGSGNAGTINLDVTNNTNIIGDNSSLSVATSSSGQPGNIILATGNLNITQGAEITATATATATSSQQGGNISIFSPNINLDGKVAIIAETQGVVPAGKINLQPLQGGQNLNINFSQNSEISASTSAQGNGGSIILTAPSAIALFGQGILKVETSGLGNAGNINFSTQNLTIADGVTVSASTSSNGNGGSLLIDASRSFTLDQSQLLTDTRGLGNAGNININTPQLNSNQSQISASTSGSGNAGNILISNHNSNANIVTLNNSSINTAVNQFATGDGGKVEIKTNTLDLNNNSQISALTDGQGNAGLISVLNANLINLNNNSNITTEIKTNGIADQPSNIELITNTFILNNSQIRANTAGRGDGGNININARGSTSLNHSQISSAVEANAIGNGGNILINTSQLTAQNSQISALSQGQGNSGNINLNVLGELSATNSNIQTSALQSSGGAINITASDIRLWGNSDITTNVFNGTGGGGDITFTAKSILAFGDSDILAFARDGKGGNIIFNTPIFFGFGYYPAPFGTDPTTLNGNNRVDINASGAINGLIILPDVSFIENSLTELPDNLIDPDALLANSCIVRTQSGSKFIITGWGGLPQGQGDPSIAHFATGEIQNITEENTVNSEYNWQKGDPIIEPTGVYRLASGELIMTHECKNNEEE